GAVKPPAPEQLQTPDYHVRVETFAEGLDEPWGIAFPDANTALITEKRGTLRVVRDGVLDPRPVANTPKVVAEGQGGLMEVALDPDYANNGWVYLSYSEGLEPAPGETRVNAMTVIVRGRIRDHAWVDEQTVFRAPAETYLATRHHYGNRI